MISSAGQIVILGRWNLVVRRDWYFGKTEVSPWKAPANFKIHSFVIRVGDWGGYMLMECDDPLEVHKFCSMLPAFTFEARPVVPVADAIRVELEAMAYRDGLKK
jgi:Protein of unknown function (DUF3303)